jgi:hypothetical protein
MKIVSMLSVFALTVTLFATENNLLKNSSFEEKDKFWINVSPEPGKGMNGSAAVRYSRDKPDDKIYTCCQQVELEPDTLYEFGGFVKTEGKLFYTKKPGLIFIISMVDPETKKYVSSSGVYAGTDVQNWEMFSSVFRTPSENYVYTFSFYFEDGTTGTAWIDDVFLRKIKQYGMRDPEDTTNVVENPRFDYGTHGYRGGVKVVNKGGINDSKALIVGRDEINKSFYAVRQSLDIEPNTEYVFGGHVKGLDELANQKNIVRITIEPRGAKDRQFHGIVYAKELEKDPKSGFTHYEGIIKTFPGFNKDFNNELTIYLTNEKYGMALVDDLYVRKLKPDTTEPNGVIAMVYPAAGQIPAEGVVADFVLSHPAPEKSFVTWSLVDKAGGKIATGKNPLHETKFQIKIDSVQEGDYELVFVMPHLWGRAAALPIYVAKEKQYEGSTCYIDRRGRAIVNGRPYMPLGFFIYKFSQKDVDILAKSPFNTLMSYFSHELNLQNIPAPERQDAFIGIEESMDALDKAEIKLIFSVKDFYDYRKLDGAENAIRKWNGIDGADNIVGEIVKHVGDHPALLAWYICDEIQQHNEDYIIARKRMLNKLDPRHPTWAVHLKGQNYRFHIGWQDVYGCDPYPIESLTAADMKKVTEWASAAEQAFSSSKGLACWGVPQQFHYGIYRDREKGLYKNFANYRYPTEHEMLSFAVNMAIHGIKGFMYFNYSDFFRGLDKDQFQKRWPGMLRVGEKLKSLEPFIMSDQDRENLKMTTSFGTVLAKVFYDDSSKPCVLLAAEGPGDAVAEFTFNPGLKSECGKTVEYAEAKYRFTAKDISCDILR